MAKLNMVQALNLALRQEMDNDDSVIVLGEDVGLDGGVPPPLSPRERDDVIAFLRTLTDGYVVATTPR